MRRFYQESWQGIPFTSFSHISFFRLADSRFYSTFYEALFRRYKSWDDLPGLWRKNKDKSADWIGRQIDAIVAAGAETPPKVLSIGSGVGYMEKTLLQKRPDIELHVNEPSTVGMKWIRKLIPADRIYIGAPTLCIPPDLTFDLIYLSAVDYGIRTRELTRLLEQLTAQLAPHGEMLCISASLLQEDSFVGALVNSLKNVIRGMLHYTGIRRQQFWGWRRTQKEYRRLFSQAGLRDIADGTLDDGFDSYWIRGVPAPKSGQETDSQAQKTP
ncbi:MAG: class I SAM-dependent methyltransferase [Desulfovibrio sp.]|nr:class I SAM-dependent methyltransferase [Desulfovibrio sp.]